METALPLTMFGNNHHIMAQAFQIDRLIAMERLRQAEMERNSHFVDKFPYAYSNRKNEDPRVNDEFDVNDKLPFAYSNRKNEDSKESTE